MQVTYRYSDHLVRLLARGEAAAARLAGAEPGRRRAVVAAARREASWRSARLDASPLRPETVAAVDRGELDPRASAPQAATPPGAEGGEGWARVLKLEGMATEEIAAVEYANLLDCFDAEPELAERFFIEPLAVLEQLHGLLCRGLVAPQMVGRPRRTAQALHDGAQGKVIYNAPDPERVPDLLAGLAAWLTAGPHPAAPRGLGSAAAPAIIVAGVVGERLLEWQPFEAANGRLARAASRVVLRARGLDPHGAAVVERELATDPVGYYTEVAATLRRRGDLTPWLERYTAAAVRALENAAAAADPRPTASPPARAAAIAEQLAPGETLTVADYARRSGVSFELARQDLEMLERAGALRSAPRSRGLRYERADAGSAPSEPLEA